MLIPIRCMTCGKLIADRWSEYHEALQAEYAAMRAADPGITTQAWGQRPEHIKDITTPTVASKLLDKLGLTRPCCRRMFLTHVEMFEKI